MIVGTSENAHMRVNPLHPGCLLRDFLDADEEGGYQGMTVDEAAEKTGVGEGDLTRILNERGSITLDIAMKLEAVGWGTADSWLGHQLRFDIAQERKRLGRPRSDAPMVKAVKRMKAKYRAPETALVEEEVRG